jgi:predicted GNAT family acetyltransferase
MPFDLSTARLVKPKGFDLSTARVAGSAPAAPPAEQPLPVPAGTKPFEPSMGERALRYMGEWGQGMIDAATGPGGGPTGVDLIDVPAGVADAAATVASGIPAFLGAGPVTEARRNLSDPNASFAQAVDDMTWAPKTPVGQTIINTVGAAFKPVADAGNAVFGGAANLAGRAGAGPLLQQDIREIGPALGEAALDLGAARLGTRAARRAGAPSQPVPTPNGEPLRPFGPEVEQARRLDLRVTPSQVAAQAQSNAGIGDFGPRVPGTMREAFTGPEFHTRAIIDNQKRVNTFAAREVGLPETGTVDIRALEMARTPHNAVFDELAQSLPVLRNDPELGAAAAAIGEARRNNPLLQTTNAVESVRDRLLSMDGVPTQQALDAIRSYRQDATKLFRQAEMGGSGVGVLEAEQAAFAYRQAADALEAAMERQAGRLYPDLVPRLRDARTALAKLHNVEDALKGTNVDPQMLVKLSERYPLSGYLAEIATAARNFPDTMKSATGLDLPIQSQQGTLNSLSLAARRAVGRSQGPALLQDDFQNRFGRPDPTFDPRTPPTPAGASPFVDYAPPGPDVPGGGNVMPPAPGGGPALDAELLGAQFDELPPAGAYPGDLTADVPPAPGGLPFELADLIDAPDFGMEAPPSRFTGAEGALPFDQGLDFLPDPEMAAAPIVRGGGDPRTVQDTLLSDELMGRPGETLGRPLDADTADRLAPLDEEMVTRPDPDLGGEFDLARDPGTDVEPYVAQGEFIPGSPPKRPRPGKWDGAEDAIGPDQLPAPEGDLGDQFALPSPQPRLPAPIMDLLDELQLADDLPPPDDVRARYRGERDIPPGARVVESSGRDGYIATRPMDDGSWQIRSAYVKEGARGKGAGQEMLLQTAREASDEGVPLHSDSKLSEDQVRVYEKLRDKGMLDFDGDLDAAKQAMDETGNATSPDGQPWIRNIRPGPLS